MEHMKLSMMKGVHYIGDINKTDASNQVRIDGVYADTRNGTSAKIGLMYWNVSNGYYNVSDTSLTDGLIAHWSFDNTLRG